MEGGADGATDPYVRGLLKHRELLLELGTDQLKTFDKAILGVSSGALAISVAFVDKLGGPDHQLTLFLFASWIAFAAAILLNIISYLTGYQDAAREVQKIDQCIQEGRDYEIGGNPFKRLTALLNMTAIALFFAGILFLTFHAYLVLDGAADAVERENPATASAVQERGRDPYPGA